MSSRGAALTKLASILREQRNARYYVKRGVIAWASHDFNSKPWAASIQVDEFAPWGKNSLTDISLTLEMATTIKDVNDVEIDDVAIDTMTEDGLAALEALDRARDSDGCPYITKLERLGARVIEFHDASLRVQGVILSVNVSA